MKENKHIKLKQETGLYSFYLPSKSREKVLKNTNEDNFINEYGKQIDELLLAVDYWNETRGNNQRFIK